MRRYKGSLSVLLLAVVSLAGTRFPAAADDFTVTNTNDSGGGSLRQAILDANKHKGADRILFNIPGASPHTISVGKDAGLELPAITDTLTLDGTSQPGFAGKPIIELEGSHVTLGASGLIFLSTRNSIVQGLVINRFRQDGILITAGSGSSIRGNYIGTDITGAIARGNQANGVQLSHSSGVLVGGTSPGARNVISGGNGIGVNISESLQSRVEGNYVGTDATGAIALGNRNQGVIIANASNNTVIKGNVIAANGNDGLLVGGGGITTTGGTIQGNKIGVGADGKTPLGNGRVGVDIGEGQIGVGQSKFVIGGTHPGEANIIAFNNLEGVYITGSSTGGNGIQNPIRANSIFSNGRLGINLFSFRDPSNGVTLNDVGDPDVGPNNLQNFPVLTLAKSNGISTHLVGSIDSLLANSTYPLTLDFFDNAALDPSGFGEGEFYLGSLNVTSPGMFTGDLPFASHFLTATATDGNGNTSEFSEALTVIQLPPPPPGVPEPGVLAMLIGASVGMTLVVRKRRT